MAGDHPSLSPVILVADDEPDHLSILTHMLTRFKYQVVQATNGIEAVELFELKKPDLLLIDAMMPGLDGFEVCRKIRALPEGKDVPILMTTALLDDNSVEKAFSLGITEYITKPFQLLVLRQRIQYLLNLRNNEQPSSAPEKTAKLEPEAPAVTARPVSSLPLITATPAVFNAFELDNDLLKALVQNELLLCYQPQYSIHTGKLQGVEGLLRWKHPGRGFIPPVEFVPSAEKSGLIVAIGKWVLTEACQQILAWQAQGIPPFRFAINISVVQLIQSGFMEMVERTIRQYKINPRFLEFEITESLLINNLSVIRFKLEQLRKSGVRIALDDFGTGYSSLSYLQSLPVDSLKIDRSFIKQIGENRSAAGNSKVIVETIIKMAHSMGLRVVAEGVENLEQLRFLRRSGCDLLQGFLLSHPQMAGDLVNELPTHLTTGHPVLMQVIKTVPRSITDKKGASNLGIPLKKYY